MTAVVGYVIAATIAIAAGASPPILADRWHLAVIVYAEGAMVFVGFLLLAVLGLA